MKKLSILLVLALLMVCAVPALAAAEWSFNGWMQSENTFGENSDGGDDNDYALQTRFTANAKVNDSTTFVYQIRTMGPYSKGEYDGLRTRLAYISTNPVDGLNITMGKQALWMAGGFLIDDFIRGVSASYQLGEGLSAFAAMGRYQGNPDNQIYAASLNGNVSGLDWGVSAISGTYSAHPMPADYEGTLVAAVNAGYNVMEGMNLSLVYAVNTKSKSAWETDDDDNTGLKFQIAYTGIEKTAIFVQHFAQGAYLLLPTENGNYVPQWGDNYAKTTGTTGTRLVVEYQATPNFGLGFVYGTYDLNDGSGDGTKGVVSFTYAF